MRELRELVTRLDLVLEQEQERGSQSIITARTETRACGIFDPSDNVEGRRHQLAAFPCEADQDRPAVAVVARSLEIPELFEVQDHLADRLFRQQRPTGDGRHGAAAKLQIRKHRSVRDPRIGEAPRAQFGDDLLVYRPGRTSQQLAQIEAATPLEFAERMNHRSWIFAAGR